MCPEKSRHSIAMGKNSRLAVGEQLECLPGAPNQEQE